MQAFILETLTGTGWRRSGDIYWTLDTARSMATQLLRKKQAQRVRILSVDVSLEAVEELDLKAVIAGLAKTIGRGLTTGSDPKLTIQNQKTEGDNV